MAEQDRSRETMLHRNLETFRTHFPDIHARLSAILQPVTRIVEEDDAVVDLDLGTGRLYKTDGRILAREQAEAFIATPRQVGYQVANAMSGDSPVSQRLFDSVVASARKHRARVESGPPVGRAGFLFIFGLGLGYHLPLLVDRLEADWVVVIETIDEFVLHSLSAIDWSAIVEACQSKDVKISLILDDVPKTIVDQVHNMVRDTGELALDGSYYYRHYPSWTLDQTFEAVVNDVPLRMVQRGYYEDERKMLWNTITNLKKYDCHMLPGRFQTLITAPAFMVTSGPSVDYDIEYIKKWRDQAIIFSGGSSLQVLLAAGIIPDYHVELENVVQVWEFCQHILDLNKDKFPDGKFTGIKLIASVTLNPRVTPLFDETYYFFRDSVSSSMCFADKIPLMSAIGPNVANTIVAVGARIGFRRIYMFGMDCGWRDDHSHHSRNTAYYTSEEFKTETVAGSHSWPGNFGGTIQSTMILSWTRDMLEEKVNKFGLRAFNCSDGALIRGTIPKLAEAIDLPEAPLDREKIYQQVRGCASFIEHDTYLSDYDFDAVIAEIDLYERIICDLCDDVLAQGDDFRDMLRRITEVIRNVGEGGYDKAYGVFQGATAGMAKCGCVFLNRIEDEVTRRLVFEDFVAEYRQIHVEMAEETREIFRAARDWIRGGEEPGWAAGLQTRPGYTF